MQSDPIVITNAPWVRLLWLTAVPALIVLIVIASIQDGRPSVLAFLIVFIAPATQLGLRIELTAEGITHRRALVTSRRRWSDVDEVVITATHTVTRGSYLKVGGLLNRVPLGIRGMSASGGDPRTFARQAATVHGIPVTDRP